MGGQVSDVSLPSEQEQAFQQFYADLARRKGINADPDDPRHFYKHRAWWLAGAPMNEEGHVPSVFKRPGHPNRYVEGRDSITGLPGNQTWADWLAAYAVHRGADPRQP